jgi:two-component system, NarL family, sensor histidine kinase UhpB
VSPCSRCFGGFRYRVAQEALTNVARHAEAEHVALCLESDDTTVVIAVRDNGRGLHARDLSSSHGIRGMAEPAMLIGAQLAITRRPERGTEVKLTIPLDPVST